MAIVVLQTGCESTTSWDQRYDKNTTDSITEYVEYKNIVRQERAKVGRVEDVFFTHDPFTTHTVYRHWNHEYREAFPSIATQKYFQKSRYRAVKGELQFVIFYPYTNTYERIYVDDTRPEIFRNDIIVIDGKQMISYGRYSKKKYDNLMERKMNGTLLEKE